MNHFRFYQFLTSNINQTDEDLNKLLSHCTTREYTKGAFLLKQGEKSNYSFFVEKGLLRQYSIDEKGKEHILQFTPENWLVSDRESEYFDQASSYFIDAIENTTVFLIHKEFVHQLACKDASFMEFNFKLLHNHIRHLQKRITLLQSATAEERYLDFIQVYPDITLRVPQTMIASYLGITPESLSRIRKDLAMRARSS